MTAIPDVPGPDPESGPRLLQVPAGLASVWGREDWLAALFEAGAERAAAVRARRGWRQAASLLKGVAAAWLDPAAPGRVAAEAGVIQQTGQAPAMVRYQLDLLLRRLAAGELVQLWEEELGPGELPACRTLFAVLAGSLSEPGLLTICHAVLLRSFLVARLSRGEWAAASAWAAAIAAADPELGGLFALLSWPPAAEALTREACARAAGVLVFGSDETVACLREWTPVATPFVGHGHRVSLAILDAALAERELPGAARALAIDTALHEQRGCLSPHYVLVEDSGGGGRARGFGLQLAAALGRLGREWPAPRLPEAEMLCWRAALNRWRMRSAVSDEVSLWAGTVAAGARYCVVLAAPGGALPENPGHRFLFVLPVRDRTAIERLLAPLRDRLGSIGVACPRARMASWIESIRDWAPSARIAGVGRMQDPPLTWRDGGIGNLAPWAAAGDGAGMGLGAG